ncbi:MULTISPECIES: FliI/YscN family ATPase [unclassified Nitratiruptor]|uniref:FliI/YscN family ATPase n=1 Tax=unclassified Nitratiruptor TaxID=2624044 RepID=UPI0019157525|nr:MULTISPECIES: FliI/YscN family ATPase [unclassified Nitratiruptor]
MNLVKRLKTHPKYLIKGKITSIKGPLIEAVLPDVSIGDLCYLDNGVEAEVVGFRDGKTLLMTYDDLFGIRIGSFISSSLSSSKIGVGEDLLGTVLDPFGNPLNKEKVQIETKVSLKNETINPLLRERIKLPLDVGVRSINGLFTIGKGQRIGIFASAGVGKSTLLGMVSRFTSADINVIALIGERGREVREFIEDNLGQDGLQKSIVVVATSDQPPLAKLRAVHIAMAYATYFSKRGKDVLFLVDSLTRLAMAQREIGLLVGEPPTSKGYTPSVFTLLPKIIERAGTFRNQGSITGIYTVLFEGEELSSDPIADAAVGFLDGHVVLSKEMAQKRVFPAVDPLKSISRLAPQLVTPEISEFQAQFIQIYALYKENEDMINMGLYKPGSSQKIDLAIKYYPKCLEYLRQSIDEPVNLEKSFEDLKNLILSAKSDGFFSY